MKILTLLLFCLATISVISCSVDESLTLGGVCDLADAAICVDIRSDFSNAEATTACSTYQDSFNATSKVFSALAGATCSTENVIGSCTVGDGTVRYYNTKWNTVDGEASCTGALNGTLAAAR